MNTTHLQRLFNVYYVKEIRVNKENYPLICYFEVYKGDYFAGLDKSRKTSDERLGSKAQKIQELSILVDLCKNQLI